MKGSGIIAVASDHRARPIPHGPEPGSASTVDRQPDDPGLPDYLSPIEPDDGAFFRGIILTLCLEGAFAVLVLAGFAVLA